MKSIFDYTIEMLEEYFLSIGEKKFKAKQVFEWIYQKRVYNFDDMSNISLSLREKLKEDFDISLLKLRKKQDSEDTSKYLFELHILKGMLNSFSSFSSGSPPVSIS